MPELVRAVFAALGDAWRLTVTVRDAHFPQRVYL